MKPIAFARFEDIAMLVESLLSGASSDPQKA
jgi:hypothetical protein